MIDRLGAACAGFCLLHCVLTPVLMVLGLSVVGSSIFFNEWSHIVLGGVMLVIASIAFPKGWQNHKKFIPALLALLGIGLMLIGLISNERFEHYWAIASALALASGHLMNRHYLITLPSSAVASRNC